MGWMLSRGFGRILSMNQMYNLHGISKRLCSSGMVEYLILLRPNNGGHSSANHT